MENLIVKSTKKDIIIRIRISDIIKECKSNEWLEVLNVAPIADKEEMLEYLLTELSEASVDVGNGYVSPVAYMIMD